MDTFRFNETFYFKKVLMLICAGRNLCVSPLRRCLIKLLTLPSERHSSFADVETLKLKC